MICTATDLPHNWIEARKGVQWCPDCEAWEIEKIGTVIQFPVTSMGFSDLQLAAPGLRSGRLLLFKQRSA